MRGQPTEVERQIVEGREPQACATSLVAKLESTRTGMQAFLQAQCLLRTGLLALFLAGLLAVADWLWVLRAGIRGAGLLAILAVAAGLLGRGVLTAGWRTGRRDTAAEVEAVFPQLGQRVRTTLDYAEPDGNTVPAAPALVAALVRDTDRRTSGLDFRGLIPWRSLRGLAAVLLGLTSLFLVLVAVSSEARTAALRLLLVPVGYTRLEVKPGDHTMKVGSDLTVEATLTGRAVAELQLQYRPAHEPPESRRPPSEDWTTLSFVPPDSETAGSHKLLGTLETTLRDCRNDLEYRVAAGPVVSPVYRLSLLRPLVMKSLEAKIEPPAYTRRPAVVVGEGNFKVIANSHVHFRITLDREPRTAQLLLYPAGSTGQAADIPSVALKVQGTELTGELPSVDKELEYEVNALASDGMPLEAASRCRIEVQPDRKPTIRFLKPRDQIEVIPTTEVQMKVEAGDDFGLAAVGIVYQIGNGPRRTLDLRRDPSQPTSIKTEAVLSLEEHTVGFQDAVTYYAFAEDNHPGRPQRTTTELQFIDIRVYKRSYQLLKTGGS
jgi:hypothetical protein